jgi:hypothetical protein
MTTQSHVGFSATAIVKALKDGASELADFAVRNVRTVATANRQETLNNVASIPLTLVHAVLASHSNIPEGKEFSVLVSGIMTKDNRTGWEFVPAFVRPVPL